MLRSLIRMANALELGGNLHVIVAYYQRLTDAVTGLRLRVSARGSRALERA